MVKCLVAILLLCISIVSASVEAGQHNKSTPPIVLEISTDKQSYHIGESVILFVKFKNVTDSSVSLPPEFLFEEHFILLTMYKDNTAVPFRNHVARMSTGHPIDIFLQPGESYTSKWKLPSQLYNLPNKPGKYRLCAHYKNEWRTFWIGEVDSECLTLELKELK